MGDRRGIMLVMEIQPASRGLWPALAELFAAGGDPRWCWCDQCCSR